MGDENRIRAHVTDGETRLVTTVAPVDRHPEFVHPVDHPHSETSQSHVPGFFEPRPDPIASIVRNSFHPDPYDV
jgi:hypothetical protein